MKRPRITKVEDRIRNTLKHLCENKDQVNRRYNFVMLRTELSTINQL